jgi:gamma-glutamyltranspeptidase/glutathione hydrolase
MFRPDRRRRAVAVAAFLIHAVANSTASAQLAPPPELPSGWTPKPLVVAPRDMVAAAQPLAVEAGLAMIAKGGSAIDAAIATQMVLNLVEPQSSGIGGGAFVVTFDARTRDVATYDGRETAPARATPDLFLDAAGKPLSFAKAQIGGRAVGTPGVLRALELAHREQGRLPWAVLFEPAIRLAEAGFAPQVVLMRSITARSRATSSPRCAATRRARWACRRRARHPAAAGRSHSRTGCMPMPEGRRTSRSSTAKAMRCP